MAILPRPWSRSLRKTLILRILTPEEVAYAGAAKLLQTPGRSRDAAWTRKFRKAYDDVVDAVETLRGAKSADEIVDMLEDQQEQDAETALVKKVLADIKKKKP
jgi:Mg/Co/Ni transporter MgtE